MSSCRELAAAALALACTAAAAQSDPFPGIGRAATPKELAAWDIDVRPDFKGLPKGSGSVARGQEVWESKCASCHGVFGESNSVFNPIAGGTTAQDIERGRVARLSDSAFPGRTTLMKLSTVSTLWDYINRAMPWAQPKSLSTEEVYAVTAYVLNLGGIVPDDFVLSDGNIAQVQQRLPNRDGMTTDHGLWPGRTLGNGGKPDVRAEACMTDCAPEPKVASFLPDHARNAHGNLAQQNRLVGAQRGADTSRPVSAAAEAAHAAAPAPSRGGAAGGAPVGGLLQKHACVACHGMDSKVVGPSFADIGRKYSGRGDAVDYLAGKIRSGGAGIWGPMPMPPQSLPEGDSKLIAQWLADGARQ
jgi:cytochrome c